MLSFLKYFSLIIVFGLQTSLFAQSEKDLLLQRDIEKIKNELQFMYFLDQEMRNYFNSENNLNEISSKEIDPESKDLIWKNFINPIDSIKTNRFLEIISKYGFPSLKRLNTYSDAKVDFNPIIILIHSPFLDAENILPIIENEYKTGNIDDQCDYGYLLWHFNGRSDFKYMTENGYKMEKKEDGTFKLVRTCD